MQLTNRIHRDFQPLNMAVSVRVLSKASPLTQVYDSMTGQYLPDRRIAPTCILPDLSLVANDGSMKDANGNVVPYTNADVITSSDKMHWIVNNKPIEQVFAANEYEIERVGKDDANLGVNTRCMLKVFKNVPENESYDVYFDGYILDKRTNQEVHVVTKKFTLNTVAKGMDQYALSCLDPLNFLYNPFMDKLLLFEWKRSRGMDVGTDTEDSVLDRFSYLHTWHFSLKGGTKTVEADNYKVKLVDPNDNDNEIAIDPKFGVMELTKTSLTIDARMFASRSFKVIAYQTNAEGKDVKLADITLSAKFTRPDFTPSMRITAGTLPTDTYHTNGVKITTKSTTLGTGFGDVELECPDAYFDFVWSGISAAYPDGKEVGTGANVTYPLAALGITNVAANADYTENVDGDFKEPLATAVDDDGNVLTDSYGNMLAFR